VSRHSVSSHPCSARVHNSLRGSTALSYADNPQLLAKISGGHRRQQYQLSVHAAEEGKEPQALCAAWGQWTSPRSRRPLAAPRGRPCMASVRAPRRWGMPSVGCGQGTAGSGSRGGCTRGAAEPARAQRRHARPGGRSQRELECRGCKTWRSQPVQQGLPVAARWAGRMGRAPVMCCMGKRAAYSDEEEVCAAPPAASAAPSAIAGAAAKAGGGRRRASSTQPWLRVRPSLRTRHVHSSGGTRSRQCCRCRYSRQCCREHCLLQVPLRCMSLPRELGRTRSQGCVDDAHVVVPAGLRSRAGHCTERCGRRRRRRADLLLVRVSGRRAHAAGHRRPPHARRPAAAAAAALLSVAGAMGMPGQSGGPAPRPQPLHPSQGRPWWPARRRA